MATRDDSLVGDDPKKPRLRLRKLKLGREFANRNDVRMTNDRGVSERLTLDTPHLQYRPKEPGLRARKLKLDRGLLNSFKAQVKSNSSVRPISESGGTEPRGTNPSQRGTEAGEEQRPLPRPQIQPAAKAWTPNTGLHRFVHLAGPIELWFKRHPYPSFELTGPDPHTKNPRDAVAFWLRNNAGFIIQAEQDWKIDRRAIAGAIAWEALENPQGQSMSSGGPGKIHYDAAPPHLSWPEAVEAGRWLPRLSAYERKRYLQTAEGSIIYLGAIMNMIAITVEHLGLDVRKEPRVLGFAYQGRYPDDWIRNMTNKSASDPFQIPPGSMGAWMQDNLTYLEAAVGQPAF